MNRAKSGTTKAKKTVGFSLHGVKIEAPETQSFAATTTTGVKKMEFSV